MGLQHVVYIIRSRTDSTRYYTGLTANVAARPAAHNDGHCAHTATAGPWEIVVVIEFTDENRARAFEKYLKVRFRRGAKRVRLNTTTKCTRLVQPAERDKF